MNLSIEQVFEKLQGDETYQRLVQQLNRAKQLVLDAESGLVQRSIELALELREKDSGIILP